MKPATEQQRAEIYCMDPKEQPEFNVTRVDPAQQQAYWSESAAQSDWAQNTTAQD